MKRFLPKISTFLMLFLFMLLFPTFSFAYNPTFRTEPDPIFANDSHTKLIVEGCPPGEIVRIEWDRNNFIGFIRIPGFNSVSGNLTTDSSGKKEYSQSAGFDAGTYSARFFCGGTNDNFTYKIEGLSFEVIKKDLSTISLTIKPRIDDPNGEDESKELYASYPDTKFIIKGCPANSNVKLEIVIPVEDTGAEDSFVNTFNLVSDDQGSTSHKLQPRGLSSGNYFANTTCGGATVKTNFTVSSTKFTLPTQPPPPSPVCENWENGRCVEVNTGVGPIKTNGAGIINSIFLLLLSLAGGIALISIIHSGYQMITSRGNPEAVQKAREIFISAVVGLLFIVFSIMVLELLTIDILHLPGFSKTNIAPTTTPLSPTPCIPGRNGGGAQPC